MQSITLRIVAAIVDTSKLTLYKEDGNTIEIPQGDARVRQILDVATPLLVKQGYADITLGHVDNPYAKFERTSGVVKLFRVAKSALKGFFAAKVEDEPGAGSDQPVAPLAIGAIPKQHGVLVSAVDEILKHAVPVSDPTFEQGVARQGNVVEESGRTLKDRGEQADNTIVAMVDGKLIPGMERIRTQFHRAVKNSSPKGLENFLKRLAAVIDQRSHSVEDLLTFLERGDLPIADDGSILIYKVLRQRVKGGNFFDCHTSKVEQWVGAYVCMDPSLVDHNRNNECSNGLHVARRGYVREFRGDVCVLAKLAPEDVIAVPTYDANKMRVCGYHILAELAADQYRLLRENRPLTEDSDGKKMLAAALAGQHVRKTHEVRITEHQGGGVVVTPLDNKGNAVKSLDEPKFLGEAEALDNPQKESGDKPVDPKRVVKQVQQLSRKGMAEKLFQALGKARSKSAAKLAADELIAFKRASKVSWSTLGISNEDVEDIYSHSGK